MAKKNSNGGSFGILLVLIASAFSALYKWAENNIEIIIFVGVLIIIFTFLRINSRKKKQAAWVACLKKKYKKDEIVNAILNSEYWKGQTSEQLIDSLGTPDAIDKQVLKTKIKETWKYNEQRKGQFCLRIFLENDNVVGWDVKN